MYDDPQSAARRIFAAAVKGADPSGAVVREAGAVRARFYSGGFQRLLLTGFGKSASVMAQAAESELGELQTAGVIVTKYGHLADRSAKIRQYEAGHPMPDANGVRATEEILRLVAGGCERTLVLALISGGGSALLVAPAEGVTLAAKQQVTEELLRRGAEIGELNAVRKHLSRVKGGRLAQAAFPAAITSLILSDVIGDPLDVIASGPTSSDPSSYADALAVLAKYRLLAEGPPEVIRHLQSGAEGLIAETPKPGDPIFERVENRVIGSNRLALKAAKAKAEELGWRVELAEEPVTGEAREAGKRLAQKALAAKNAGAGRLCLISGGETTVRVTGEGSGGRNMELTLVFAREIAGVAGITLLSAGTDGTDGPTDAAGAEADGTTIPRAIAQGLDPEASLADNDSYNFFKGCGGLLITGPTGTNVMDLQIVLID